MKNSLFLKPQLNIKGRQWIITNTKLSTCGIHISASFYFTGPILIRLNIYSVIFKFNLIKSGVMVRLGLRLRVRVSVSCWCILRDLLWTLWESLLRILVGNLCCLVRNKLINWLIDYIIYLQAFERNNTVYKMQRLKCRPIINSCNLQMSSWPSDAAVADTCKNRAAKPWETT